LLVGLLIPGSLTVTGDLIAAGSLVGVEDTELEEDEVTAVEDAACEEDEVTAVEDVEFEEDEGEVSGAEEITVAAFPGAGPNEV
jgi:hypothetical protein